jgi:deoxycytidine triphosphate deaminase
MGLIEPFLPSLVRVVNDRRIISAGLSSYGYDCRLARDEFKVFSPVAGTEIDPKRYPRTVAYVDSILSRSSFAPWIERETAILAREPV